MQPPFDHFKMFNTHCHGIRKVSGCFGKKKAKNTKAGAKLIKHGGCTQETSSRTFQKGGELINYGVHSGIFLKKPLSGNHLHFVKK